MSEFQVRPSSTDSSALDTPDRASVEVPDIGKIALAMLFSEPFTGEIKVLDGFPVSTFTWSVSTDTFPAWSYTFTERELIPSWLSTESPVCQLAPFWLYSTCSIPEVLSSGKKLVVVLLMYHPNVPWVPKIAGEIDGAMVSTLIWSVSADTFPAASEILTSILLTPSLLLKEDPSFQPVLFGLYWTLPMPDVSSPDRILVVTWLTYQPSFPGVPSLVNERDGAVVSTLNACVTVDEFPALSKDLNLTV